MRILPFLAVTSAALAAGPTVADDAVVLASTAPALTLGQVVADGTAIRVPEGASALFLLASGRTVTLRGPFEGNVEAAAHVAKAEPSQGWVSQRFAQGDVAASRAMVPSRPEEIERAIAMDLTKGGRHCVVAGHAALVSKPRDPAFAGMTLSEAGSGARAVLSWTSGEVTAWPREIPLADGARVQSRSADGRLGAETEIRAVDADSVRAKGLPIALASAGCTQQVQSLLTPVREAVAPVDLYLSSDRGQNPTYRRGETARLALRTNRDAKVYCFLRDPRGDVFPIFPSLASGGAGVKAESTLEFPSERMPIPLTADNQDVRCVATEGSAPDLIDPSAAFRPLARDAIAKLDRAIEDAGHGQVAKVHVLLRTQ
jgi:hypothetical protein